MRSYRNDSCFPSVRDFIQIKQQQPDSKSSNSMTCRICLCEEEYPDHELIQPCQCAGSMKYIGLSCIKQWLHGKRHHKETQVVNSYIWKGLECELCKSPFKDLITGKNGNQINLLNFKIYEESMNYMVIESVTATTSKTIHVLNFDANPTIKVGRAQVAEVRITDISVSRHHSTLRLISDGSVTLSDNYSKFGTLLLLNKPLAIIPSHEGTYMQIGRTMLSINSKSRLTLLQKITCCSRLCKKRTRPIENNLHFEETHKFFPQEFTMMFNPGAIINAEKVGKMIKGDANLSVEHCELKQKSLLSQDDANSLSPRAQG